VAVVLAVNKLIVRWADDVGDEQEYFTMGVEATAKGESPFKLVIFICGYK